ncbi:MAG TPA: hypothetical protein DEV93_14500 [Chloroflexi bacterium]|jgi:hypothetical protein|nr:hypothetical protein [Chloroflexota bacterium]
MVYALVCVALGLPSAGIDVVPASPTATQISARHARRIATKNFGGFAGPYTPGWKRVEAVSAASTSGATKLSERERIEWLEIGSNRP